MRKLTLLVVLFLCLISTILLGSGGTQPSLAAAPVPFDLQVFSGFRRLAPPTWLPITIRLETYSEPLNGELVITLPHDYILTGEATKTEYRLPLTLPAFARQTYRTTVLNPVGAYSPPVVKVYSQGQLLMEQALPLETTAPSRGILIVSDHEFNTGFGTEQPVFQLKPTYLPSNPVGYWGIEAVLFDRAELTLLTAQQIEALAIWVRQGGTIILTGGNRLQALTAPLLAQLTTCRFKQKTVLPLTGDENDVLPFPEDLQWLEVFQVDPGAAEVLLTMQGFPLLLQETLGAGVCYILTFDPFGRSSPAPLTGEDWWKTLLPVSGVEGELNHGFLDYLLPELLRSSPQTLPSKFWVVAAVAGLCLSLYLYARSTRNLPLVLMYAGYLLLIVVYTGLCTLLFHRLLANAQQNLSELAIIHKAPHRASARIEGYYALFARQTAGLELSINRTAGMLTGLSPQAGSGFQAPVRILLEEEQSKLQFPPTDDNWLTMGFRANYFTELPVYVTTESGHNHLTVEITNDSTLMLTRLLLYSAGRWFPLGQVAPGETGLFRVDLNAPGETFATGLRLYPPSSWGLRTDPAALRRELLNTAARRLFSTTTRLTGVNRSYLLCLLSGERLPRSVALQKPGEQNFSGLWLFPVD
ncbi:MAG: hypothetical protein GX050_00960 [Firmicutes bacterium]|nr:hypothetical protein [Bacillota bacterium]